MKIIERLKELRANADGGEWIAQREFIVDAINALPALLEVAEAADGVIDNETPDYKRLRDALANLREVNQQ